jgi:hypothetical protein
LIIQKNSFIFDASLTVKPLKITNKQNYQVMSNTTRQLKDVFLTKEEFEKDLDSCLLIQKYPSKRSPYYVCEHISTALIKGIVKVYVIK